MILEQHLGKTGEASLDPPPQVGEIVVGRITDGGFHKWLIFEVATIDEITPNVYLLTPTKGSITESLGVNLFMAENLVFDSTFCRYPTRKEFAWYRKTKGV